MMSAALLCALLCHILFRLATSASRPSHGDVFLSCSGLDYTSKGTVSVYDAALGHHVNICKEHFDRGAAAAVCRQLGYVDADIAEAGQGDSPPKYFTDAYTLRCAVKEGTREVAQSPIMSFVNCPRVGDYVHLGQLHIMRCLVGPVQTETCTPVAVKCNLQKLNESDQYRYNGLVWRSAEQTHHGHHTVELYRDGVSKPLCCPAAANENEIGNGLSVPMSTTICRQLGYTTGRGTCIDNDPVTVVSALRDGYLPENDPECDYASDDHCHSAKHSLSCFTDYMSQVTITDDKCSNGVAVVQCSFNQSDEKLMSAGSRGDCMMEGAPSPYIGTTYGFGAAFLVTLLILIVVVVVCSTCLCKCNRGNGGERERLNNRQD